MNMKYQEVQILDAEKSYASTLSNSEAWDWKLCRLL